MSLLNAVKVLNEKAAREKWYYYCDPTLAFTDSFHDPLLNTWRAKRAGRVMPRRSELTARDLKDVLRNIVVFERVSQNPSHYRWRLIGTRITEVAGDHTGKTFEETLPQNHMERWVQCYDLVLASDRPLRFLGRVHLEGKEYLDADNLYVPLANDNDEPTFAMALCRYTPRRGADDQSWENLIASIPGVLP